MDSEAIPLIMAEVELGLVVVEQLTCATSMTSYPLACLITRKEAGISHADMVRSLLVDKSVGSC